jgi:CubicO group peptidase (beta-lactamase class C family)
MGTLALGQAMAAAAGKPYITVARDEILTPLGMHMTEFTYTPDMQARAATGYHSRRSPMRLLLPRWVIGDPAGRWVSFRRFLLDGAAYGGLLGPVRDAARFLQMHLRDGELDGARILAAESAAAMRRITTSGRRFDLGLGWFRPASQRHADPPFVEHLGGGAGFFNLIRIYPKHAVGIAVMGNATNTTSTPSPAWRCAEPENPGNGCHCESDPCGFHHQDTNRQPPARVPKQTGLPDHRQRAT